MGNILLKKGLIFDAVRREPSIGDILVVDGKIARISDDIDEATGIETIDCQGLRIYPGFVEAHSHLGLDAYATGFDQSDYNEANDPVTPHLRAIDGYNPQDRGISCAMKGGVTTICTGPGSANVLGGTFTAIKTVGNRVENAVIKEEVAMKTALGENPKRCYSSKSISSRMTTAALLREQLFKAKEYTEALDKSKGEEEEPPKFDMKLNALVPVIRREMPLKVHAHRADDIFTAIRIAREFNIRITLEHVTDGSLIADELAKEGFPCAVGPSLGHPGKVELTNKSFETPGVLSKAGCQVSIITDAGVIPQECLALCAGLAVKNGMDEFEALKAITINPARHIGIEKRVGSIELGKDGDFVITKADPMLSDTEILYTIIDGNVTYKNEK